MQILPTKTPNQANIKQTYLTFSKIYGKNRQEEVRRKTIRIYSIGRSKSKRGKNGERTDNRNKDYKPFFARHRAMAGNGRKRLQAQSRV